MAKIFLLQNNCYYFSSKTPSKKNRRKRINTNYKRYLLKCLDWWLL